MKRIKILLIAMLVLCLGLSVTAFGCVPTPTPTATPVVISEIEISTPMVKIQKGTPKEDVFGSFTYKVTYNNGTSTTYTSMNDRWLSRLTCSPDYDPTRSGITYSFSVTYAGITSNTVNLSVPAEADGLILTVSETEIPAGLTESTFLSFLSVETSMTDGSRVPCDNWTVGYDQAFDTSAAGNTFDVYVTNGVFESNRVSITVTPAEIVELVIESTYGNVVPYGVTLDDFLDSLSVSAVYTDGRVILLSKQDVDLGYDNFTTLTVGHEFTITASYLEKDAEALFEVGEDVVVSIELENNDDLFVVEGTEFSAIVDLLGDITYVYASGDSVVVSAPNIAAYTLEGGAYVYDSSIGQTFEIAVTVGSTISEKVKVTVVADVKFNYPTLIPINATASDVAKFVGVQSLTLGTAPHNEIGFETTHIDSAVVGAKSTFVITYANKKCVFETTTAEFTLHLAIKETSIAPGTTIQDLASNFELFIKRTGETDIKLDAFELETDYLPTSSDGTYYFRVVFGQVVSNVINADVITDFNDFTFNGIDPANPLVVPYGASEYTVKNAFDIWLTKDGTKVGTELSIISPMIEYGTFLNPKGGQGTATNYTIQLTVAGITKTAYVTYAAEDTSLLGMDFYFDAGQLVTSPVSGTVRRAPGNMGTYTKYYYGIDGIPAEVYSTNPLRGTEVRFSDARGSYSKYIGKFLSYYVKFISGEMGDNDSHPQIVGDIKFKGTFYHSLCASEGATAVFKARIKLTVLEIVQDHDYTVADLNAAMFNNSGFISYYGEGMNAFNFNTEFVFSSVVGEVAVGDEIWIDITGNEYNLIN